MKLRASCFWASVAGSGWVLAGYPLSLAFLPRRPWRCDETLPKVSILIPAFHEREALPAKLAALAQVDYPYGLVEVLVLVDEDRELARLASSSGADVTVLFSQERRGKAASLNRGLERASGEVVVMTDANNKLEPGALSAAMRHFADERVWAVAGRRGEAGSAYDRYEDALRRLETRSGSVAAMSGEFMAVRRERCPRFPEGVVNDDLWLLCRLVAAGGRVVYEPEAASEEPPLSAGMEVARRSRMAAGRVLLLPALRGLPPGFAFRVLSHKHGRLALPFLLVSALCSSLTLSRSQPYRGAALVQLALCAAGAISAAGKAPGGVAGLPVRAAGQFVVGNVAVGVGVIRALRGRQAANWEPVR